MKKPDRESPFVVLKFGGTSVARPQTWHQIIETINLLYKSQLHPVLVCSALSGVTDALEGLASAAQAGRPSEVFLAEIWKRHEVLAEALGLSVVEVLGADLAKLAAMATERGASGSSPSWRARILSAGEFMSTRLGAAWLNRGEPNVRWLDARRVLKSVPEPSASPSQTYLSAHCEHEANPELRCSLLEGAERATITQGFVASNAQDETVLLGRGGSDTSAAYLAAMLEAIRLEIWTDVPGMFTADPRHAPAARLLPQISYEEAAVSGSLGAKILHPRCLPPLQKTGIPLAIRWTERPWVNGTLIGSGPEFLTSGIKSIASRSSLCLVRMQRDRRWQPVGFMADVATCFYDCGLSMDLISSSPAEIRATIDLAAEPSANEKLPALLASLSHLCEASIQRDVACISIAGTRISEEMPRIANVLRLLGIPAVHMVSHAADDTHVSYVIDAAAKDELAGAVHLAIFGDVRFRGRLGPTWAELQHQHAAPELNVAGT